MRHNDARKWLHAALDLLPVLLIPVFMIYSHRHTMTEQTTVDIQYKYQSNEVNSFDDLIPDNVYHLTYLPLEVTDEGIYYFDFYVVSCEYTSPDFTNYSYQNQIGIHLNNYVSNNNNFIKIYYGDDEGIYFYFSNNNANINTGFNGSYLELYNFDFYVDENNLSSFKDFLIASNFLPSISDFNVIESVDVQDETSSVMNVFMDNFNSAVDKYFNMGNVFNLNGVYQWFNTNIFNGNAPQIIYSVWNIALYELVMDLLFLLYGLFMWFIDMCKHLMEKPFKSIK